MRKKRFFNSDSALLRPRMTEYSTILLELQYLPSVQYFSKLLAYEQVYLEAQENYVKGSYRNRAHIADSHGVQRLSIPLQKGKNEQQNIREVAISFRENWHRQHWQAIRSAYGRAPFFEFYADELQPLFEQPPALLWDWNFQLLETICELLSIDFQPIMTEIYEKKVGEEVLDFRSKIHPKAHRALVDEHFAPVPYAQVFQERHGFLPNLSILDVLFCCGPESYSILMRSFQ